MGTNGTIKCRPNFNFEKDIDFSVQQGNNESYEEIAKRLIKQFKEEMEELKKISFSSNEKRIKAIIKENKDAHLDDDEDALSQLDLIQKSDNILNKDLSKYETQIKEMTIGVTAGSGDVAVAENIMTPIAANQRCCEIINDNIEKENFLLNCEVAEGKDNERLNKSEHNDEGKERGEVKLQIETNMVENVNVNENDSNHDLVRQLIKNTISDYETISRILLFQNEKLRKLNSKHMRNYFKRQLDQKQ